MDKLQRLISGFQNHTFTSSGQIGSDYEQFESEYKEVIKEIASDLNAQLVSFNNGHYYFSAFVEKDGNFAYISIEDVRYAKNGWKNNILVRTAKSSKDYSGGRNTFSTLESLKYSVELLLRS